jgi:hypothetical protein
MKNAICTELQVKEKLAKLAFEILVIGIPLTIFFYGISIYFIDHSSIVIWGRTYNDVPLLIAVGFISYSSYYIFVDYRPRKMGLFCNSCDKSVHYLITNSALETGVCRNCGYILFEKINKKKTKGFL